MIVRTYFDCATCGHKHTLRISVGANSFQKHSFACCGCGETIEVGMTLGPPPETKTEPITNCVRGESEGSIVNLHPDFLVGEENRGRDRISLNIAAIQRLQQYSEFERDLHKSRERMDDLRAGRVTNPTQIWPFVKRLWSLFLNGQHQVCFDYSTREFASANFDEPPHPFGAIYAICRLLARRHGKEVFDGLTSEWQRARSLYPDQLGTLRSYFLDSYFSDFLTGSLAVVTEYMDSYSEFSQVLLHQAYEGSADLDLNASSMAFDRTKMIFGNAFEHLASYFVLPACLNNILSGRAYDTFQQLTLEKFLDLDKSGRVGPFRENPQLAPIAAMMSNQLRNASHHGSMRFNPGSGYIAYRPKRTGDLKYIRYVDYLIHCATVVQSSAALVCFVLRSLQPEER
jgi:hypothetical protein